MLKLRTEAGAVGGRAQFSAHHGRLDAKLGPVDIAKVQQAKGRLKLSLEILKDEKQILRLPTPELKYVRGPRSLRMTSELLLG